MNDTFITVRARLALWIVVVLGGALLVGGTAYQAKAVDRQLALDARV